MLPLQWTPGCGIWLALVPDLRTKGKRTPIAYLLGQINIKNNVIIGQEISPFLHVMATNGRVMWTSDGWGTAFQLTNM